MSLKQKPYYLTNYGFDEFTSNYGLVNHILWFDL